MGSYHVPEVMWSRNPSVCLSRFWRGSCFFTTAWDQASSAMNRELWVSYTTYSHAHMHSRYTLVLTSHSDTLLHSHGLRFLPALTWTQTHEFTYALKATVAAPFHCLMHTPASGTLSKAVGRESEKRSCLKCSRTAVCRFSS